MPAHGLKQYISDHEYPAEHYYSAYPEASATMVVSALELRRNLDRLRKKARSASAKKFDKAPRCYRVAAFHGANALGSPRRAGPSSGQCRPMTADMSVSAIHSSPSRE